MKIAELLKNLAYAVVFALFIGLIIGIWSSDLLYRLVLKSMEPSTARYVSVAIISLFMVAAFAVGFTRGRSLLE